MENVAVLVSDLEFDDPRQMMSVLRIVMERRVPGLLILAGKIADAAIALLSTVNREPEKFKVMAVEVPGATLADQVAALQDLSILTGGRFFTRHAGQKPEQVRFDDLGRARKVWVERLNFGIIGGQGDPRVLRKHIADLRSAFKRAEDADDRRKLQERIGKLMGGSATLFVGANTELEIEARKELAKRTADALRGAIIEGFLPGGGVALLACRSVLRDMLAKASDPDERAAYQILIRAFEEPIRTILTNAGHDASEVMAEIKLAGPGHGFDARSRQVVDVAQSGILDVASVQKEAVRSAVSGAALALTVDVLVHRKSYDKKMSYDTA
jgi:chaperonin GroEL